MHLSLNREEDAPVHNRNQQIQNMLEHVIILKEGVNVTI